MLYLVCIYVISSVYLYYINIDFVITSVYLCNIEPVISSMHQVMTLLYVEYSLV